MNILTGDVGGTHSRLELFDVNEGALRSLVVEKYSNTGFESFEQLLQAFVAGPAIGLKIESACFAVAGPVAASRCHLTNLDWTLDAQTLAAEFGFSHCFLLNDFAAIPYGVDLLPEEDMLVLQAGRPRADGVRVFVGAGTGLGQALSIPVGDGIRVLSSEAGHADFAPGSARQMGLVAQLRSILGPVSNESLLSGRGLVNIYTGLFDLDKGALDPSVDITSPEAPAQITAAARKGDELAALAVAYFFEMLGSYLGDVALQTLPFGGIYLAGGIVPKLLDLLDEKALFDAYGDKAKMHDLLREMPIHVILNEGVARLGAARYAQSRLL